MTDANQPAVETTTEAQAPAQAVAGHAHDHGDGDGRMGWLRIALVVVGAVVLVVSHSVLAFLVVFSIILMVVVHELGHFITAKASGMKVTEFFMGFGPKLWSITRGETEYGVKLIPAGAYVKIIGMNNLDDVDPSEEERTYRRQPYWQRIMVASAGSFMHFVMAFLILVALNGFVGMNNGEVTTTVQSVGVVAGGDGPAGRAGVKPGDKIVAIDGQAINEWKQVSASVMGKANQIVTLTVERDGQRIDVPVTPMERSAVVLNDGNKLTKDVNDHAGFIGIVPAPDYVTVGLLSAVAKSGGQMWDATKQVVTVLTTRFSPSGITDWVRQVGNAHNAQAERDALKAEVSQAASNPTAASSAATAAAAQQQQDQNRLISPLGLIGFAGDAADAGLREVLALLFSINVFVGIFNMVPLLPFDGGHVAVATYERLRSRSGKRHMVDFNKLLPVSYAVLFVLVFMGLSALWLDIIDPAPDPFS